jgi:exonuclease VII large subunit
LQFGPVRVQVAAVPVDQSLVDRVAASTGLTPGEAARVVEDVVAYYAEPVEEFVRRRHQHLKTYGARNPEIFTQIADELAARVVAAPELTERQLRRIVYG